MKSILIIFVSLMFPSLAFAGNWVTCASEGRVCHFSGTKQVMYGANGKFVRKTITGGTVCSNQVFGDPAYGENKECRYYQPSWTFCAKEGQNCTVSGTKKVKYGVGSQWAQRTVSGSVSCRNSVFGDPAYGATKSCFVYK